LRKTLGGSPHVAESESGKKPDNPEQYAKFKRVARELQVEETGDEFERAIDAIVKKKSEQPTNDSKK
jgi:hypothetical protein